MPLRLFMECKLVLLKWYFGWELRLPAEYGSHLMAYRRDLTPPLLKRQRTYARLEAMPFLVFALLHFSVVM